MFNYTSTAILNSSLDSSGVSKVVGETLTKDGTTPKTGSIEVRRSGKFLSTNVTSCYHKPYQAAVKSSASIQLPADIVNKTGQYRIEMYIRLSGNQNSYYSNAFVFKGQPFYIPFVVKSGDTLATIEKRIVSSVASAQRMYDMKWLNVKKGTEDGKIEIEAVDEYQIFSKLSAQYFDDKLDVTVGGRWVDIADVVTVLQGTEGSGNWIQLTKNLHLPTGENNRFMAVNSDERPVMGGTYDEYVIHYKSDPYIGGAGAVGQTVVSTTTHVFYVEAKALADFKAALVLAAITPTEVAAYKQGTALIG